MLKTWVVVDFFFFFLVIVYGFNIIFIFIIIVTVFVIVGWFTRGGFVNGWFKRVGSPEPPPGKLTKLLWGSALCKYFCFQYVADVCVQLDGIILVVVSNRWCHGLHVV